MLIRALAAVVICAAIVWIPQVATAQRGSISVGQVTQGHLVRGVKMASQGPGWTVLGSHRGRKRTYGVAQLVRGLRRVAKRVRSRHRGAVVQLGDLSQRQGGRITHHASHQSGRDVDIAFFARDERARRRLLSTFVHFDRNLRGVPPAPSLRFDVARNWTLVESLLAHGGFQVQFIFVAPHLKAQLLSYAGSHGRPPRLVRRARRVLRTSGTAAPHDDHFHVRIYCPPDDVPQCVDTGPRWPWVS